MNFWANLFHSCTVLICEQPGCITTLLSGRRPYMPSSEEKAEVSLPHLNELQADPKLYASNVRQYMLEKQKVLETLVFI